MDVIIILLLIVVLIWLNKSTSYQQEATRKLSNEVNRLLYEMSELKKTLQPKEVAPKPTPLPKPEPEKVPAAAIKATPIQQPPLQTPLPEPPLEAAPAPTEGEENVIRQWLGKNPDLEKFIGENLINKIGIAILVLGIAFFVKYAIDQNWISEAGRVSIGLLCGALLIGIAHHLRNTYRPFSSVLAGGGIAVFYCTIAFAFHQYHLFSQTAAFILMIIITAFAVTLSLLYDKMELAIIASIGGFITPFLVSTGEGNYVILLTYLIILNSGLLSLAYFKRWTSLTILSLLFTELIVAGWMVRTLWVRPQPVSYLLALTLITILYLLFLGTILLYPFRKKQPFHPFDFSLLLFLTGTYYAAGMILLDHVQQGAFQGFFTLALGLLNLALAYFIFRKDGIDRRLLFLLIALTLSFLSLAIPVQLDGHTITLFWSAEFVVLFWLSMRSGIRIFRISSFLVALLTLISLAIDWEQASLESDATLQLLFTNAAGLVTNLVVTAAFALLGYLHSREGSIPPVPIPDRAIRPQTGFVIAFLLAYITCIFGINLILRNLSSYDIPNVYHRITTILFSAAAASVWQRREGPHHQWWPLGVLGLCLLHYLGSTSLIDFLRNGVLTGNYSPAHLWAHAASILLLLGLFFWTIILIRRASTFFAPYLSRLAWGISAALVLVFSLEFRHLYLVATYGSDVRDALEMQYQKAPLTILWALCSFALMWLGMEHKAKNLRIISLSLFSLALLKLFFLDIRNISEGGKIIAFLLLGVLLLTISFMYQKLKKMLLDEVNT